MAGAVGEPLGPSPAPSPRAQAARVPAPPGDRRRMLQRLGRQEAPLVIAGAGPAAEDAGAGAGAQAAGDARLRGSGSSASRRASSRTSRAARGRGGVRPVAPRLRFPPPRSAGPLGPGKGPHGRAGRAGRYEVRAPAPRLPLAGAGRSSNKFCVSAIHSSHYLCTNQRRPSGPGGGARS